MVDGNGTFFYFPPARVDWRRVVTQGPIWKPWHQVLSMYCRQDKRKRNIRHPAALYHDSGIRQYRDIFIEVVALRGWWDFWCSQNWYKQSEALIMLVDSCFGVWTVSTVLQEGFKITSAVSPCSFIIISSPFFSLFSLTSACLFRERTEFASRQPPGSLEKPMGEASEGAAEKKGR